MILILLQLNVNIFGSVQKKISFLRIKSIQTVDLFPYYINLLKYCSELFPTKFNQIHSLKQGTILVYSH